MSELPDWATSRGEKWRANLDGMEATLRPVDAPLLDALQLDAPCAIADLACGGGGTTLQIAQRAPAGSTVHGFDISPALIEAARARAPALSFEVADLQDAAPPRPYDRLSSRFGVMFFAEPQAAFRNLARWLAPGGRFAFAVWGRPADNPWQLTVREVVSTLVEVPPLDTEGPGPFRYGDVSRLLALLDQAGFREVAVRDWHGELHMGGSGTPEQASAFALSAFGAFGEMIRGVELEARERLAARLVPRYRDGAVYMPATVHLVTGRS